MMRKYLLICFSLMLFSCNQESQKANTPNILMIIADDLGYTDLGCYGGEINTPTIDSLAATGMMFTNFHTGAMCAPSRSTLFTGQDHHLAGWGRQRDVRGTFYEGKWGYENELSDRVLAFPRLLQANNFASCFAGKWHLGKADASMPVNQGFDQSFVLLQGAANHWNDIGLGLSQFDGTKSLYNRNGQAADWPSGKYSTTVYTDEVLQFINNLEDEQAFFAVASYTAPHWPLQPPEEYKDRYKGRYDDGYNKLREKRLTAAKAKSIIDEKINLPPGLDHIKDWDSLSEEEQKVEARKMELYAAMLEHLDHDLGRLLDGLRAKGELENTIIIFMSDNGADFLDFYNHPIGGFLRDTYDNSFENMGDPSSFVSYGPQWAQACMSPFSYYKGYLAEGGVRAPLIISGPGVMHGMNRNFLHIQDLAPTILDIFETEYPEKFEGNTNPSLIGKSFAETLKGEQKEIHAAYEFFFDDFQGMASIIQGDFKLLNTEDPTDNNKFKMYNIKNDPGEKINIRSNYRQQTRSMLEAWEGYKKDYRIVYPKNTKDLNPYKEKK